MRTVSVEDLQVAHLSTLCSVVDAGSYAAAARALDVSVPTLWNRVRALEARYGATFFEKRGRRVVPTPEARRLVELARPILAALESTLHLVGSRATETAESLTLVTGMRMALEELAPVLARFREEAPQTRVRWLHADNLRAQDLLVDGTADLAVLLNPPRDQRHRQVVFEPAYELEYLMIAPADHPLARRRRLRLEHLLDEPLVVGHTDTIVRTALEHAAHRLDLSDRLQPAVETDNSALTIACVQSGLGIGVIAGRPRGRLLEGLAVRSLSNELGTAALVVAQRRGTIPSTAARRLGELLAAT